MSSNNKDHARLLYLGHPPPPSYFSAVHSRVHDVNPALEDGHLEEGEVGVAHVVKVDVWVLPGEAEGEAGVPVGDEVGVGQLASVVQALETKQGNKVNKKTKSHL